MTSPMDFWTLDNLEHVMDGRWLHRGGNSTQPIAGVGIDSRTISRGQAYVAIKGEKHDGHDFLADAYGAGSPLLVVHSADKAQAVIARQPACHVLLVRDTVQALQHAASAYREALAEAGCKVVAITGSSGKTTTRQLIDAVLRSKLRGTQSPKSFNNHLGVPLTILGASLSDEYLVAEVGTNHPGEIGRLAAIVQPDIAVLTNIGAAHIGNFGSREAIAQEKMDLPRALKSGGLAVIHRDERQSPFLEPLVRGLPSGVRVIRHGAAENCDLWATVQSQGEAGVDLRVNGQWDVHLPMPGEHNAQNALAAIAVAREFGLSDAEIAHALLQAKAPSMRMQVMHLGARKHRLTVILDAYNANPESSQAAVQTLSTWPLQGEGSRRVAVLGDMLELGEFAPQSHRSLGQKLAACGDAVALAVLIGPLSMFTAEALARSWPGERLVAFAQWSDDLPAKVASLLRPGDVVLIKASRGMALERLLPGLEAQVAAWDAGQASPLLSRATVP